MVVVEFLLSYSKILVCFCSLGLALFYLLFKIMTGSMFYYYTRSTDFIGKERGLLDSVAMGKKFKPVFKEIVTVPVKRSLYVEGVFANDKKFKRLEQGALSNEVLLK